MTIDNSYVEKRMNATAFVAVITPRYLRSAWCIKELETFKPTISDGSSNLYPVYRFPIDNRDEIPAHARDMLGYVFYIHEDGIPIELEADSRRFLIVVATLASDIVSRISGK